MPRKAKDKIDENKVIEDKKNANKKTSTVKKSTAKKAVSDKDATTKTKKSKTEKDPEKKASTAKKNSAKKSTKTKSSSSDVKKTTTSPKATTAKKTTSKSTTTRKRATKKTSTKTDEPTVQVAEYYDLPYKYGNTVVRLLAQTPKTLFVYWEVSDNDIENFKKAYGDDFFSKTKPILLVHNMTLNKTTEIEINDFANCWYLNIEDVDCKYDIELARKYFENSPISEESEDGYLSIANSNDLQSPNNHILFEKIQEFVVFRNVNNDNIIKKNIKSFKFLKDIYKFYKDMYDEDILNNPSSQFKF